MPQVITTNLASLNAQRNLDNTSASLGTSLQRLSSGLRINSAKDDAAGLAISTRITSTIKGLTVAQRNANDAISLSQIAEGALQESTTILQRMRELSLQSANGTNSGTDRNALQAEVNQLKNELSRIAENTGFNGLNILDGTLTSAEFQIGSEANQTVSISISDTRTNALGSNSLNSSNTTGIEAATRTTSFLGAGDDLGTNVTAAVGNNGLTAATYTASTTDEFGAITTQTSVLTGANEGMDLVAADIDALTGVTARAFNSILIDSGSTINAAEDNTITIGAAAVTCSGDTLAEIAAELNANGGLQTIGAYARLDGADLYIIAPNGQDIAVTASANASFDITSQVGAGANDTTANETDIFIGTIEITLDEGVTLAESTGTPTTEVLSAGLASETQVNSGQTAANAANNNVAAQNLFVSGSAGSGTVAVTAGETAKAIATNVNKATADTGVRAEARTEVLLSTLSDDGSISFDLFGDNSTAASVSASVTTTDFSELVSAINNLSGTTGISAQFYNGSNDQVLLVNSSGEDIRIENFEHSTAVDYQDSNASTVSGSGSSVAPAAVRSLAVTGNPDDNAGGTAATLYDGGLRGDLNSTVVGGEVNFISSRSFVVSSNLDGVAASGSLFAGGINASTSSSLNAVNNLDISSQTGAQDAIVVIDEALTQISGVRADLGAIQSRFESATRNIANNIENLSSARSRILDADFAVETSELTKTQILSQAGISMLSQANQLPQNILQLLQ